MTTHVYSTGEVPVPGGPYPVTITLSDDSGGSAGCPLPLDTFNITATATDVPLTSVSAAGNWLQVNYTVPSGAN